MKTGWMALFVAAAMACGGTESPSNETMTGAQATTPPPDVSGNYTLNQYASYLGAQGPDVIALSGPMTLKQNGSHLDASVVLTIPNPANAEQAAYTETRSWSGAVAMEQGIHGEGEFIVVRLNGPIVSGGSSVGGVFDTQFIGVLDANGDLTGPPGTRHGYCAHTPLAMGCDAIRKP